MSLLCSDGVGRSGTFICIHAQLERLKTEGVVDFFQSIKLARIQRPGLVPDVVSKSLDFSQIDLSWAPKVNLHEGFTQTNLALGFSVLTWFTLGSLQDVVVVTCIPVVHLSYELGC